MYLYRKGFSPYSAPTSPPLWAEEWTESDKYKQWVGSVEGNYLPEQLAHCQHEDIHLFCIESDSLAKLKGEGGEEWDSERDGREREPIAGCERQAASGNGRAAEERKHLKVLNLWSR